MGTGNQSAGPFSPSRTSTTYTLIRSPSLSVSPLDLPRFWPTQPGGADLHCRRAGTGIHTGDQGGDQLLVAALEFLHLLTALRLADALTDDMLGRLRGDAAEFPGFQGNFHRIAHLGGLGVVDSLLQRHFHIGILHLIHHGFVKGYRKFRRGGVHDHPYIFLSAVIAFDRDDNSGLDLFHKVIRRNALFLFQQLDRLKNSVLFIFFPPFLFSLYT